MRAVRQIAVGLIVCALSLVPATGFAQMRATQHVTSASVHDMSAGAPEHACPCCDPAPASAADVCMLKCCGVAAVLVEAQAFAEVRIGSAADTAAAALSPFARPPDPPPPRP